MLKHGIITEDCQIILRPQNYHSGLALEIKDLTSVCEELQTIINSPIWE